MQYVSDSFAATLENVVLPVPAELWSNKPFGASIPGQSKSHVVFQKKFYYFADLCAGILEFIRSSYNCGNVLVRDHFNPSSRSSIYVKSIIFSIQDG